MKNMLAFLLLYNGFLYAQDAKLTDIKIQHQKNHWQVTPQYQLSLSKAIVNAIESGVEITFMSECQLLTEKNWWPDRLLATDSQGFEIHYFSLTNQYQLKSLEQDYMASFLTLNSLLQQMGENINFNLPLNVDANMTACRLYLDHSALPSTMQLPILWDDNWSLDSNRQSRPLPTLKTP